MNRYELTIIVAAFAALAVWGRVEASHIVSWDGVALGITWDDTDNTTRLSIDNDGYLLLQEDPNNMMQPGPRLMYAGQPIAASQIVDFTLNYGGGADELVSSEFPNSQTLTIYGGAGNDLLKIPQGTRQVWAYGGAGDDVLNAELAAWNYLYGEDGDDTIWNGLLDGSRNYMDGGGGTNTLLLQTPFGGPEDPSVIYDTLVHHAAANDTFWDVDGTHTTYILVPDSEIVGSLTVLHDNLWTDRVYTNSADFDVDGDGNIVSSWITGTWEYWDTIEQVIRTEGDWNTDGSTDASDYVLARKSFTAAEVSMWHANFGASHPEPSTALLAVIGSGFIWLRRRQ